MSTTTDLAKILKRLAAVDTLAREGATEGERSAARSRAAEMRRRHGITDEPPRRSRPVDVPLVDPDWLSALERLRQERRRAAATANAFNDTWTAWPGWTPYEAPRPRDPEIKLRCSCGHVTTKVLLNPLTRILAYRCVGCQQQRRDVDGEFSIEEQP